MIVGNPAARGLTAVLLLSTSISGAAFAQTVPAPPAAAPAQAPAPLLPPGTSVKAANANAPAAAPATSGTIKSLRVIGNERLEPETVLSYIDLRVGEPYDRDRLDRALKALFNTELFTSETQIRDDGGAITIQVRENPVINRVIIEGSKRVKEDKIREEIRVAPRQIFTRSRARADVGRILELYRRSGRFAASVEPKIVQLDQNRVDLIFEISEGPKSKVRQINIIGNERFSDGKLRGEMATRAARWYRLFTSNDTYDPDRIAFDQQKMRQFYLTQGYADFRVVSATAELTPDRRDFIVTYVVEEGDRYKFGDVELESKIRDVKPEVFRNLIRIQKGDWYNAKLVEDTIDGLTDTIGLLGYAFSDVRPNFDRDKDKRLMNVTFVVNETPRVYVESVDINGNVRTKDEVIRREFRLAEGDAFNSFKVKRSRDRIQSLGFFQEKLEVNQRPGSGQDKVVLSVDVEEKPTGSLQISAGYSSLERFILSFSIEERNFRGRAQQLRAGVNLSSFSRSVELGFTEPYLGGRNLALGADLFRRDFSNPNFFQQTRQTSYKEISTGGQLRVGFPITEFWSAQGRYGLSQTDVTLDPSQFFTNGVCDPLKAGRYLCEALGSRLTSAIGYTLAFDNLDNRLRPNRGQRFVLSQDVAGIGFGVRYIRSRINYDRYFPLGAGFVLNLGGEGGNIFPWGAAPEDGSDPIRLVDRFFLGEPRFRGFSIRGVGPRVLRTPLDASGNPITDRNQFVDDALGGRNYYIGRAEVQIPLGAAGAELGLRPSVFVDAGALWGVRTPQLTSQPNTTTTITNPDGTTTTTTTNGFVERFVGNSPSPRVSVGFGVSWNSPFGPFRFDVSRVLRKVEGDNTQTFQFNVGTQF